MGKLQTLIGKIPTLSSFTREKEKEKEKEKEITGIIVYEDDEAFSREENNSSTKKPWYNLFWKRNKLGLSNAEIRERMCGICVYTISDHTEHRRCLRCDKDKDIELFFFSKSDAEDCIKLTAGNDEHPYLHPFHLPLSQIVSYEGIGEPIRLVPEISQVKNAQQTSKDIAGVPVFLTNLRFESKYNRDYLPMFLRKEDLEETLVKFEEEYPSFKKDQHNIQVVCLEDIIKSMKDCSTSKWNDVVFIEPGHTIMSWVRKNDQFLLG